MKFVKILLAVLYVTIISSSIVLAQEHNHLDHSKMKVGKDITKKIEDIIRKGVIDLHSIDKNKDGKVFQDQMDWNVISDSPGKCPVCNMILREVPIKIAKQNLIDAGFKVKDKYSNSKNSN